MHALANSLIEFGRTIGNAALETLWPTRCVLCDEPGSLLCRRCLMSLPFLDQWRACPRCGAPYGLVQCCTCNPVMMPPGFERLPFDGCVSAVHLTQQTGRMVTVRKDKGEQALSLVMAWLIFWSLPPSWQEGIDGILFIPSSRAAMRKRGFDHARLLAEEVARLCELPLVDCFERPRSIDQRALSRDERFLNMRGAIQLSPEASLPAGALLIDDVLTTGASLFAACDALSRGGVERRYCATFARA